VGGNFSSGNNSDINVASGSSVLISKNLSIGSGNLNGSGTFQFGGTCMFGGSATSTGYCHPSHYNSTLPVEIIFFNASRNAESGVDLNWSTATEKDFNCFVVERSDETLKFNAIAKIMGKAGQSTTNYQFIDTEPFPGRNYYRLKSIDLDESFEYSKAVVVQNHSGVTVYPTIMNDFFSVYLGEGATQAQLTFMNSFGKTLFTQLLNASRSEITFPVPYSAGVYYVKIDGPEHSKIIRVLVK
jgi:hypothetical protein